jgi:hypothetical protein
MYRVIDRLVAGRRAPPITFVAELLVV